MPASFATIAYVALICVLFLLERDRRVRTSAALWLPVIWVSIACSRTVSQWLAVAGYGGAGSLFDSPDQYLEGDPVDRMVFLILLALGIVVLVRRGPIVGRLLRANTPILLFYLYCATSVVWSSYPDVALKRWFKAIGDVVMVLVVLTDRERGAAIRRLFTRTAFLLIPLSVLFIKYYPDIGRGYRPFIWEPLYVGVTTNKNVLGLICLLFGLASEWRLIEAFRAPKSRCRTRWLSCHGAVFAMSVWLLWISHSTTSLACFLLGSTLLLAAGWRVLARTPSAMHLLGALVVIASFSTLFADAGGSTLEAMGKDSSLTGRTAIWEMVLRLSGNPLVGTGFESFWLGWRLEAVWRVMRGIQEAHNGYLEVYVNLGWIGVGILAAVLAAGYRSVSRALRRDPEFGALWFAYFLTAVIYNFTEAGFRMSNAVWITLLLAVMAASRPARAEAPQEFTMEPAASVEVAGR